MDKIRRMPSFSRKKMAIVAVALIVTLSAYSVGSSLNSFSGMGGEAFTVDSDVTIFGYSASISDSAAIAAVAAADAASAADAVKAAGRGFSFTDLVVISVSDEIDVEAATDTAEAFASRMVVFTARIDLKVDNVDSAVEAIQFLTEKYGGFIASVNTRTNGGAVTIRVPQMDFHEVVGEVELLGEVVNRDLKGKDVTEDYVDLESRLGNLETQEDRLLEILELGTTVESVLKVERELERVRGEIESIVGRMQYLESRVELATVTVLLNEVIEEEEPEIMWLPDVDWGVPVRTGLAVLFSIAQGMLTMVIVIGPFLALGYSGYFLVKQRRLAMTRVSPDVDGEVNS
ncbi:MAG: DUF4349 domain-containing protein [Candidatus Bathyarchaeota archaeon]|nr:DUF4349 domain-containing protein [Candidatus Bathyarchaeota archaeon]